MLSTGMPMQGLEVRPAQIALDLRECSRAHGRLLGCEMVLDHVRERELIGRPTRSFLSLRVLPQSNGREGLLRRRPRLIGRQNFGRTQQHPSRGATAPVLHDPGPSHPVATSAKTKPETREAVVKMDRVWLAVGQFQTADGLGIQLHAALPGSTGEASMCSRVITDDHDTQMKRPKT
jgi:hypothetical protein